MTFLATSGLVPRPPNRQQIRQRGNGVRPPDQYSERVQNRPGHSQGPAAHGRRWWWSAPRHRPPVELGQAETVVEEVLSHVTAAAGQLGWALGSCALRVVCCAWSTWSTRRYLTVRLAHGGIRNGCRSSAPTPAATWRSRSAHAAAAAVQPTSSRRSPSCSAARPRWCRHAVSGRRLRGLCRPGKPRSPGDETEARRPDARPPTGVLRPLLTAFASISSDPLPQRTNHRPASLHRSTWVAARSVCPGQRPVRRTRASTRWLCREDGSDDSCATPARRSPTGPQVCSRVGGDASELEDFASEST